MKQGVSSKMKFKNLTISLIMSICLIVVCIFSIPSLANADTLLDEMSDEVSVEETVEVLSSLNYVALGDSIATGYGLDGYTLGFTPQNSYVSLFSRGITSDTTSNLAVDGLASPA